MDHTRRSALPSQELGSSEEDEQQLLHAQVLSVTQTREGFQREMGRRERVPLSEDSPVHAALCACLKTDFFPFPVHRFYSHVTYQTRQRAWMSGIKVCSDLGS